MNGYIKLYRKMAENPMWLSEPFDRPRAWIDLLMLTNHKPGYIRVRGIRVPVERGQCGWSQTKLAERWQWSRGKVRRFIDELVKDGMIEQQTVQQNKRLIILNNIINYEHYQGDGTTNDTTNGHQTDIKQYSNKNEKNEKNNKPPSIPPPKKLIDELKEHLSKKIAGNGLEKYSEKLIEFIEYRMSTKGIDKYKTIRGVDGLIRDSKNCLDAGLNLENCLDITIERSWLTPDINYFKEAKERAKQYHKPKYAKAPDGWSA